MNESGLSWRTAYMQRRSELPRTAWSRSRWLVIRCGYELTNMSATNPWPAWELEIGQGSMNSRSLASRSITVNQPRGYKRRRDATAGIHRGQLCKWQYLEPELPFVVQKRALRRDPPCPRGEQVRIPPSSQTDRRRLALKASSAASRPSRNKQHD